VSQNQPSKPHGPGGAAEVPPTTAAAAAAVDAVAAAAMAAGDITEATQEADQLRTDLERFKDLALRAHADLENYRKRVAREMEDERRYGSLRLLRELLPVVDNLARAIEASEKSADNGSLLQGVKMVARQLDGILEQHHCRRIEALHQPFDPARHQAIMQQPSADYPAGTVILVAQDGYMLYDRVVRPSQVIVSATPPEPGQEP